MEGAIDSEAMRARGIIIILETKQLKLAKHDSAAIVLVFKIGPFRF